MSLRHSDGVAALIAIIVGDIAPAVLSAYRADPRGTSNPGLAAASATLDEWMRELARTPCAADALSESRLAAVLRAGFVAAASVGRVVVGPRDGALVAELELSPCDIALVEAMLELAVILDARRGSSVGENYNRWRDDTLARLFGLARHRADLARID